MTQPKSMGTTEWFASHRGSHTFKVCLAVDNVEAIASLTRPEYPEFIDICYPINDNHLN